MHRAAQLRRFGSGFKIALAYNSLRVREPEARMISKGLKEKIRRLLGKFRGVWGVRHMAPGSGRRKQGETRTGLMEPPALVCDKPAMRRIIVEVGASPVSAWCICRT